MQKLIQKEVVVGLSRLCSIPCTSITPIKKICVEAVELRQESPTTTALALQILVSGEHCEAHPHHTHMMKTATANLTLPILPHGIIGIYCNLLV